MPALDKRGPRYLGPRTGGGMGICITPNSSLGMSKKQRRALGRPIRLLGETADDMFKSFLKGVKKGWEGP